MDNNSFLKLGLTEQNNISQLSDCILHYYKTNINENAKKISQEIISIIDNVSASGDTIARIDELGDELLEIRIELSKDCVMFDQFMQMNDFNRKSVVAILDKLKEEINQPTQATSDEYDTKAYQKRYEDLHVTTVVSEQMDQQLKLMIANNQTTIASIETTVFTTITLWKNRLFLENQRKQYE